MSLTKEQILAANDRVVVRVPVPEWGEAAEVCVRSLSGDERDTYEQTVSERRDEQGTYRGLRAALVALALCDDSGEPLGFTELEVEQLGSKNGAVLDRLFEKAKELSGMGDDAIEDAEKNSSAAQSESSGSS